MSVIIRGREKEGSSVDEWIKEKEKQERLIYKFDIIIKELLRILKVTKCIQPLNRYSITFVLWRRQKEARNGDWEAMKEEKNVWCSLKKLL